MNAPVTTPRTGFAYLDRVLDGRARCSRSRTAAAPTTPRSRDWRTPSRRSGTPSALGYDYLETDVHVTRDGVLLAFHDSVLDRVTDRSGEIAAAEPAPRSARPRGRRPGGGAHAGRAVRRVPRRPVQHRPQVRGRRPGAGRLHRRPRRLGPGPGRLVLAPATARSAADRRPGRRRAPPPAEIAAFRLLPSARLAALARRRAAPPRCRSRTGAAGCRSPPPGLVRRAHAAGRHVHVWTIDDADEMHELLDRGVDGLFTDRTDILKDVLVAARAVEG